MTPDPRRMLLAAVTGLLSASAAFVAAEVLLRLSGRGPWQPIVAEPEQPDVYGPDPLLGWAHEEGVYDFAPFSPFGQPTRMTILADGSRATGPARATGRETIVMVGGSFTQGFAISDHETFAWKLQEALPSLRVRNHGTGGYGTYQSLLVLEKLVATQPTPTLAVYGFYTGHEIRNVASADWLRWLALLSEDGHIAVPHATLDDGGKLARQPAASYPRWLLREHSAFVTFLQDGLVGLRALGRETQKKAVTEKLLLEMNDVCRQAGVEFLVVFLYMGEQDRVRYGRLLRSQGIEFANCSLPLERPEFRVPGDGHPNGKLNELWSACLVQAIRQRLATRVPHGAVPSAPPSS